jgi:5-methylcytosine-specific restriction endonuclease McrA
MTEKRTYQQRREYMLEAVKRRRVKVRKMAVEYKGGGCEVCGYDRCMEALEFHHLDPTKKDFGISAKGYSRSWEKVKTEIEKCVLLCANCHREYHAGKLQLSQATVIEKSDEFREAFANID